MPPIENAASEGGEFTSDERKYFDSRGESDIPAAAPPPPEPPKETAPPDPAPPVREPGEPSEPVRSEDGQVEQKEERKVDYGAFAEERNKRKETEERLRQSELLQARMEERFKAWQEATRPPQAQAKRPPRADEDIFGAVNHIQQTQERQAQEIANYRKREAEAAQISEIMQHGVQAEAEYRKTAPDYDAALDFLRQSRSNELATWGMDPQAVRKQLIREEQQLVARAVQDKRNPAEMAYTLATQRGYAKKSAPPPTDPADRLERVEHGQKQNKSMSGTGGNGASGGELTLADLVRLPDAEFTAFRDKYPARYRRLKGADR